MTVSTPENLTAFQVDQVERLTRIEEAVKPLAPLVAEHAARITKLENRQFQAAAMAGAGGMILGFMAHPLASLASLFKG